MDIVIGIVGALLGGSLFSLIRHARVVMGLNLLSLCVAVVGAVILILVVRAIRRRG